VCTIVLTGTAEQHGNGVWNAWKAGAGYKYTSKKDKTYEYTFEAWTESGTRNLNIMYYWDESANLSMSSDPIPITATPTTYTFSGQLIPKTGIIDLLFHCADKTGKFNVKNTQYRRTITQR